MTLETAKSVVTKEVNLARESNNPDGVRFDLFGGEPLLQFSLIKDLCTWIWETITDVKVDIFITTNGTLLDDEKKAWFKEHRDKINLILSVDGKDDVQVCNRGCQTSNLPIMWVIETMPNYILSMTVSKESLPRYADDVIYFHEQGYRVDGKPAQGVDWQKGDGKIYEEQLSKIADYYLAHPEVTPIYIFGLSSYVHLLNNEPNEKYGRTCGVGEQLVAYDVEGRLFPCHHFLPNVNGKTNLLEYLNTIDFTDSSIFADEECMKCEILKICRTCCARNFNERGDFSRRDKRRCQMMLAEGKVVSSYQINKYMRNKDNLTPKELLNLKAAIKCHQLCLEFEKKLYASK
jgi:radical SAM protein with 4Fe4S-binding SPASM domain